MLVLGIFHFEHSQKSVSTRGTMMYHFEATGTASLPFASVSVIGAIGIRSLMTIGSSAQLGSVWSYIQVIYCSVGIVTTRITYVSLLFWASVGCGGNFFRMSDGHMGRIIPGPRIVVNRVQLINNGMAQADTLKASQTTIPDHPRSSPTQ